MLLESTSEEREAARIVETILNVTKQPANFIKVQAAKVPNAEACFATEQPLYRILISPSFFSQIDKNQPQGWAKTAILAHEIAHILNQDVAKAGFGTNPDIELKADVFAGEFLGGYGIGLQESQAAYNSDTMKIGGNANTTYPPIEARISAIVIGWRRVKDPERVWNANDSLLEHDYGQDVDGVWVSKSGEALNGYMILGPSVSLTSGVHKVSFLYRCKKDEVPTVGNVSLDAIQFEVKSSKETNSFRRIPLDKCTDVILVESWTFTVSEIAEQANSRYDFRVFSYRNAEIRVKEIKVEKIVSF